MAWDALAQVAWKQQALDSEARRVHNSQSLEYWALVAQDPKTQEEKHPWA